MATTKIQRWFLQVNCMERIKSIPNSNKRSLSFRQRRWRVHRQGMPATSHHRLQRHRLHHRLDLLPVQQRPRQPEEPQLLHLRYGQVQLGPEDHGCYLHRAHPGGSHFCILSRFKYKQTISNAQAVCNSESIRFLSRSSAHRRSLS